MVRPRPSVPWVLGRSAPQAQGLYEHRDLSAQGGCNFVELSSRLLNQALFGGRDEDNSGKVPAHTEFVWTGSDEGGGH